VVMDYVNSVLGDQRTYQSALLELSSDARHETCCKIGDLAWQPLTHPPHKYVKLGVLDINNALLARKGL